MIAFNCSRCGASYSVKDEFAGRKTKCAKCATPLSVPASPVRASHPSASEPPSTMKCPSCAEEIQRAARKCRFCGLELTEAHKSPYADIWMDEQEYLRFFLRGNASDFVFEHQDQRRGRWKEAAMQGVAPAQNLYALSLEFDNEQEAALWWRKAAEQGHADAQFNLAICFRNGNGVTTDRGKDVAWMRKAAEQGHPEAQEQVSLFYFHGEQVPRDDALSLAWITKAAEQGYVPSQFALGDRYENGLHCEQNRSAALHWYAKAASQGYEGAADAVARLRTRS